MRTITNEYKTGIVQYFVEDSATNDYYIFGSTINSDVNLLNTVADKREFLNKTIFGLKVDPNEIFAAIKNYPWQPGSVYTQYDDGVDISGSKFYAVVYPVDSNTGDYLIFKCLSNNYGAPSEFPPFYLETVDGQLYSMADGYVWKFMYALSVEEFDRYNTYGYIPIKSDGAPAVDDRAISHIQVENPDDNTGYIQYNGTIGQFNNDEVLLRPSSGSTLSEQADYYNDQVLYVTNAFSQSRVYKIIDYRFVPATGVGRMRVEGLDAFITAGSSYQILPRVEIIGDGSGASAIPMIESGSIKRIQMVDRGAGYTLATARVVNPSYFTPNSVATSDVAAIIRPILAPGAGHGMDLAAELQTDAVIIATRISAIDIQSEVKPTFPNVNTYSRIGLVKNPEFKTPLSSPTSFSNRIYIEPEQEGIFPVNTRVRQANVNNEVSFEAVVHEVDSDGGIYLAEFVGPYQNMESSDTSFDVNLPLSNEQNQTSNINTAILSDYVQRTGEVLYLASFAEPITRTNTTAEQYKIVLQF